MWTLLRVLRGGDPCADWWWIGAVGAVGGTVGGGGHGDKVVVVGCGGGDRRAREVNEDPKERLADGSTTLGG